MNVRWWHSQRLLVASLVTATLAVGVLTSLVIRQQQGQADGRVYLETGGTVKAKPVVPVIRRPTMVGPNVEGAPIQATAGAEERTDDRGGSQVRCVCVTPPPASMIQPKVQPIHRGMLKPSFRPQRIVVNHWDPPAQPHASGPVYQPTLPDAGPSPDDADRPEKIGPSGAVMRPEKIGPSGEGQRPGKVDQSGPPTPRTGPRPR